ncbi:MAG TPA: hypothetical protein O0X27_07095 [Methanocorpusculum sp.]|nr:hypothetical protein [Methanocorpusculum sp.]
MDNPRSPEVIAEICRNLYRFRNSSLKISADEFRCLLEERPDLRMFFEHAVTEGVLEVAPV